MLDPRGPEAAAGSPGGGDLEETKPSEANKLFGVKEGTVLGVGGMQRPRRQRPAPTRASRGPRAARQARRGLVALPPLG